MSSAHDSMACLDYVLGTASVIPLLLDSSIHDIFISDHSTPSVTLHDMTPKPKAVMWHFLTNVAGDRNFQDMLRREWPDYFRLNHQYITTQILFWKAGKTHLWERIINVAKIQEASCKLREAQQ